MLIYRPLQTKGFIKEFTDTLLTMVMKYLDLSSWEISTHTSTRLQIWSSANSPPGFPPKHYLGISTLTFTVSLKGSLLLALSGMCHPNRKFQWAACRIYWSSLPVGSTRKRSEARITECGFAEFLCPMLRRGWQDEGEGKRWIWVPADFLASAIFGGSLFGTSIMMALRWLLVISVLLFNPCALWFALYWTWTVWTNHKSCLEPGVSKTFGAHKWARAD